MGASLDELEALRGANLRWLSALTDEEWERWGMHGERGRESLRHLFRLMAAHDLLHRRQIERIQRAILVG